jgi:prolyl 4-hydroxylase
MNTFVIIILLALVVHFVVKSIEITIGFLVISFLVSNIFLKKEKNVKTERLNKINDYIYILDDFLNEEECNNVINQAKKDMIDSPLTRFIPNFRTSKTSYNVPEFIENKLNNFLGLHDHETEACQVHYYKVGEQFKEHYDWFDDPEPEGGQRTWSIMIYLNDVESGGETHFPKLKLNLVPKRGTLVLWNNLNEDNTVNYELLHSGKPVISGDKWILTKWLRL